MTKHYEQRKAANERYLGKLDRICVRVPAGNKAVVEAAAQEAGLSVNKFIEAAVLAQIGLDSWPVEEN